MDYKEIPTVVPDAPFDDALDGQALRAAMKGSGTDEQAIIDILTARTNSQRQEIITYFLDEYGRDLDYNLIKELGEKFEDVIIALMMPSVEYLCKELYKSLEGIGSNEEVLVEILCANSNEEIAEIVKAYEDEYDCPLAEDICSETSGHFRRLLTHIVTGVQNPAGTVDAEKAKEQAAALYAAGEAKLGTDEEVFNRIMAYESFAQLRLIFKEYKKLSGMTLEQAIKHEMTEELHEGIMAIVECAQSPPAFFAKRLFKAMNCADTDDRTLIRIIVSRSEIDLGNIKSEFERLFNRTLVSAIKSEVSGDYKRVLCALIGGA